MSNDEHIIDLGNPKYRPSTADTPLREPRPGHRGRMVFLVAVEVSEPPPDWVENTLQVLRRETGFCLGKRSAVTLFPEVATTRQVIDLISGLFDGITDT